MIDLPQAYRQTGVFLSRAVIKNMASDDLVTIEVVENLNIYTMKYIAPLVEILTINCPEIDVLIEFKDILAGVALLSLHVQHYDPLFDDEQPVNAIGTVDAADTFLFNGLRLLSQGGLPLTQEDWRIYRQSFIHEISIRQGSEPTYEELGRKIAFISLVPKKLSPNFLSQYDVLFYVDYLKIWLLLDDLEDARKDLLRGIFSIPSTFLKRNIYAPGVHYKMYRLVGQFIIGKLTELINYAQNRRLVIMTDYLESIKTYSEKRIPGRV